jgi:hypothetical protein
VTGFNSSEAYSFNLALASGDSAGVSYADSAMTSASIADGATETVSFGDVTFSKAGTYTFNVTEAQRMDGPTTRALTPSRSMWSTTARAS